MSEEFKMMRWRFTNEEKTKVEIEVTAIGASLTAEQIEQAMIELASIRFQLNPPADEEQPKMPPRRWVDSPLVTVHAGPGHDHWFLSICDKGRGWLHYRFPQSDLREFRRALENAESGAPMSQLH